MYKITKNENNLKTKKELTKYDLPIKLSELRKKILFELSINPRFSYSRISKILNVSPEVISYNIEKLKEQKILAGSIAIIDPKSLNLQSYELYLRLKNYDNEQLKKFIDYFVTHKNIRWVAIGSGHYDLMLSVVCKDFEEFNNALNEIKLKLANHLSKYLILPLLDEDFLYSFFFIENLDLYKIYKKLNEPEKRSDDSFQKWFNKAKNKKCIKIELDELDKKILSALENNTTASLTNLSKKHDVSVNTIKKRITDLINKKVIKKFFPIISYNLLGYQWHLTMLNLELNDENEKKFLHFISTHPCIVYYSKTIGQYNYIISIIVKNAVHYNNILLELRNHFHKYLNDYEDILVFTQYKYSYLSNFCQKL